MVTTLPRRFRLDRLLLGFIRNRARDFSSLMDRKSCHSFSTRSKTSRAWNSSRQWDIIAWTRARRTDALEASRRACRQFFSTVVNSPMHVSRISRLGNVLRRFRAKRELSSPRRWHAANIHLPAPSFDPYGRIPVEFSSPCVVTVNGRSAKVRRSVRQIRIALPLLGDRDADAQCLRGSRSWGCGDCNC